MVGLRAVATVFALLLLAGCAEDAADGPRSQSSPGASEPGPASPLAGVAERFVGLGTTSKTGPRWARQVSVYVGGEKARTLVAAEAADQRSWRLCPPSAAEYAMRKCPVSPFRAMDLLAEDAGMPVYEDRVPTNVGCDTVAVLPDGVRSSSSITIRPDRHHRDCFSDFAITLYVDAEQRVSAVSFTLSSP